MSASMLSFLICHFKHLGVNHRIDRAEKRTWSSLYLLDHERTPRVSSYISCRDYSSKPGRLPCSFLENLSAYKPLTPGGDQVREDYPIRRASPNQEEVPA